MKQELDLQRKEILDAYRVKKGLPAYLDQSELVKARASLNKRMTLSQAFDMIDIMTYPYNAEMKKVSGRLSVANIVLDKLMEKLNISKEDQDQMWKDAKAELDKANKAEIKRAKAAYKKLATENKKHMQAAEKGEK